MTIATDTGAALCTASSATFGKVALALAAAQARFTHAARGATGEADGKAYRMVSMRDLVDACRPHLAAEGLVFLQPNEIAIGGILVRTIVVHAESEEWIADGGTFLPCSDDAKDRGARMLQARRAGLASLLGIADEVEDAESHAPAIGTTPPTWATGGASTDTSEPKIGETMTRDQEQRLASALKAAGRKHPSIVAAVQATRAKAMTEPVGYIARQIEAAERLSATNAPEGIPA